MKNEWDTELERIKQAKLQEILKRKSMPPQEGETATNRPITITDATFKTTVLNHPLVVIDCWAPGCGPCHMIAPAIEELARDYAGKILFGKLNVDENPEVTVQYGIMSIPTLLVFKNGKLVDRLIGAMPKTMLEQRIRRYL
ncbi:MAG: thioredoxin [Candidatus Bathycorpusculaceae bacterium]